MPRKYRPRSEKQATDPTVEAAFRDDEIICLICGKGGMKTLARHLNFIHNLKPGGYRKLFGIRGKEPLTAKNYRQKRKEFVEQNKSAVFLPKARAAKAAKLSGDDTAPLGDTTRGAKRVYRRRNIFGELPSVIQDLSEALL